MLICYLLTLSDLVFESYIKAFKSKTVPIYKRFPAWHWHHLTLILHVKGFSSELKKGEKWLHTSIGAIFDERWMICLSETENFQTDKSFESFVVDWTGPLKK